MSERAGLPVHPCLRCGACCAAFRVSFYWGERIGAGVPDAMTRRVSLHRVAMAGTTAEPPRCVALDGEIGESVRCTIYDSRPSPCREFEPSFESGERNVRCDQARLRHGLAALTPDDWAHEPSRPIRPGRRRRAA